METKKYNFEVKSVSEDGTFEGYAAVHGNVDQGNDIIEQGAFTKTLQERNKKPVFDEHKTRIGAASLQEDDFGLKTFGKLNLDKQSGKDAYSDLKFYRDQGMQMGMSIGYSPVPGKIGHDSKSGARLLREVKLYEVTLTIIPMNELASVTSVKSMDEDALFASIEAFHAELKSGRKISKDRAERMFAIMAGVSASLTEFHSLMQEAGIETAIATPADEPNSGKSVEPDYHSLLTSFDKFTLKGVPAWN